MVIDWKTAIERVQRDFSLFQRISLTPKIKKPHCKIYHTVWLSFLCFGFKLVVAPNQPSEFATDQDRCGIRFSPRLKLVQSLLKVVLLCKQLHY